LAKNKVEILQVRRIKFVKNGHWKLPLKMQENFNRAMPSSQDLYQSYIEESHWDHYKQRLVQDIVRHKNIENRTRMKDVPYTIQVNSLRAGSLQSAIPMLF
jgi:hypothetical protein